MVEVPVQNFELSVEILLNKLFQFTLHEHMVVTMIDSGLLFIISYTCLNERGFLLSFVFFSDLLISILKLFFWIIFLSLVLLVRVLEVPFHEHILLLEFLMLLLVSPNVNETPPACPHYSVELRDGLNPQRVC